MIKFDSVTKSFGDFVAIDNLNLEIPTGTLFGYIGPNGAGKTTTIKMLAGLLKPTSGKVYINDIDIHSEPMKAKRLFGYVPDKPFLYDKLTADELMNFIGGIYGLSRSQIKANSKILFDIFEITPWRNKRAEEYSQGMKQKLLIASGFIHDPKIFLIDEPMVGLDPKNIINIKTFLREKVSTGTTVFLSTHSLHIAEELCDKIGILNEGKIIAEGTNEELKKFAKDEGDNLETLFLNLTATKKNHNDVSPREGMKVD